MKNTHYAKLKVEEQRQVLEYAPSSLTIVGKGIIGNPTREDYLSVGWKEVVDVQPPQRPKYHIVRDGYREDDETISILYTYEEDEVLPRHWTPLSVKRTVDAHAANAEGDTLWTLLRQMLVEMNYLEDFWGSQYIAEDDDAFKVAYQKACDKFGKAMIDSVIDEIPTENM